MATSAAAPAPAAPPSSLYAPAPGSGLITPVSQRLSRAELSYISGGVSANLRSDGRSRLDFRPLRVEVGVVGHANGSARVRLAATDVMAVVNLAMVAPDLSGGRCEGSVGVAVERSAACALDSALDERQQAQQNAALAAQLHRLISHSRALPLPSLVIVPDAQVWHVSVDVLVLRDEGNVADAAMMAAKAALVTTTLPPIELVAGDAGSVEIVLNDDPFSYIPLPHAPRLPLLISLSKIGASGEWILDATSDEEECESMRVSLAVDPAGNLCGLSKSGPGCLNLTALEQILSHVAEVAAQIDKVIMDTVRQGDTKAKAAHKIAEMKQQKQQEQQKQQQQSGKKASSDATPASKNAISSSPPASQSNSKKKKKNKQKSASAMED